MNPDMIVYEITNTVNGKRYIGMTGLPLRRRWQGHKDFATRGEKTALACAMRLYGYDAFTVREIARLIPGLSRKDFGHLERAVIAQERTIAPVGYNMTAGGDGVEKGTPSPNKGKPLSLEQREKLKEAWARNPKRRTDQTARCKGKRMSDQARANLRNAMERPITKARLLAALANRNRSDEHRAVVRQSWTAERRAKAAEILRQIASRPREPRVLSNEQRSKLSEHMRSLRKDPEFRRRHRASWTPEMRAEKAALMRHLHAIGKMKRSA